MESSVTGTETKSSITGTKAKVFDDVQTVNSVASAICGITIHGYILYKMLRRDSSLSQYQDLIVLQSIVGLLSITSRILLNQTISIDGETHLFFTWFDFHPVVEKAIFFLVATSEAIEEFLIIAFNIHRVLIFLRPHWVRKFYFGFTPTALAYVTCYGILMSQGPPKQLLETVMEIILVPAIVVVSMVCYVFISKHFRSVSGYTEKVKQMQARFSTSIYLQGSIHSVLGVIIAVLIPLHLLVAAMTNNEGVISRFALFYDLVVAFIFVTLCSINARTTDRELNILRPWRNFWRKAVNQLRYQFIIIIFRWYSAVTGALMLWSVRGFFQQQKVRCTDGKQLFNCFA